MTTKERRVQERVPVNFEVNFIHEGDYLISFSDNISVDGIFLFTETPPEVGDITKLNFSIGDLKEETVDAKVIWVNKSESSKDTGVGLRFIKPSKHLKTAVLHEIKRVALLDQKTI